MSLLKFYNLGRQHGYDEGHKDGFFYGVFGGLVLVFVAIIIVKILL